MELEQALESREPDQAALQALFAALRQREDPLLGCEVLEALCSWLRRNTWDTQRLLAQEKEHALLVGLLRRNVRHTELVRNAFSMLSLACHRSVENSGPFCRAGIAAEIIAALRTHNDSVVLDRGCEALWRLGERGGAPYVREAGGTMWLLEVMRLNRENPFVQSNACGALHTLVCPTSPLQRMCEEARSAMAAHVGHSPIRRQAERLIQACEELAASGVALDPGAEICLEALAVTQVNGTAGASASSYANGADMTYANGDGSAGPRAVSYANGRLGCTPAEVQAQPRAKACDVSCTNGQDDALSIWLRAVDDEGYLLQYLAPLRCRFTSPLEVFEAYGRGGRFEEGKLDSTFFEHFGVRRLGHRRLFEVWFRDHKWRP